MLEFGGWGSGEGDGRHRAMIAGQEVLVAVLAGLPQQRGRRGTLPKTSAASSV